MFSSIKIENGQNRTRMLRVDEIKYVIYDSKQRLRCTIFYSRCCNSNVSLCCAGFAVLPSVCNYWSGWASNLST